MKTRNNHNIWAPWRNQYIRSIDPDPAGSDSDHCFFCDYWANPDNDRKNRVLWRTNSCLVVFNKYPYTAGHLLITPEKHLPDMDPLDDQTLLELMRLTRDSQKILRHSISPHGFNVGINLNRSAGAGLPGHFHIHVVPRWQGDTNFMSVTGDVRVISQSLDDLYDQLKENSEKLNLPAKSRQTNL